MVAGIIPAPLGDQVAGGLATMAVPLYHGSNRSIKGMALRRQKPSRQSLRVSNMVVISLMLLIQILFDYDNLLGSFASPPQNFAGVAGTNAVTLRWQSPTLAGEIGSSPSSITAYRVWHEPLFNPQAASAPQTLAAAATTHIAGGLSLGVRYVFYVAAVNDLAPGHAAALTLTPARPPSPPRGFSLVSTGDGSARFVWRLPSDEGGAQVLGYVAQTAAATVGPWTNAATVGRQTTALLPAANGQTRWYRLLAYNDSGVLGAPSTLQAAIGGSPPGVARQFVARSINNGGAISVSWLPPAQDFGFSVTLYELFANSASPQSLSVLATVTASAAPVQFYIDAGVSLGELRYYQLRARNARGWGQRTNTQAAIVSRPPSAPRNLSVSVNLVNGAPRFVWQAPTSSGGLQVTGYALWRLAGGGAEALLARLPASSLAFAPPSLPAGFVKGQPHTVLARAINAAGEGDASTVSLTPLSYPGAPRGLTVFNISRGAQHSVRAAGWLPPLDTGGAPVTGYVASIRVIPGAYVFHSAHTPDAVSFVPTVAYSVGQTLDVAIFAQSSVGMGPPQVVRQVAALAPSPVAFTYTPQDGGAQLRWSPPSNGGLPVLGYAVWRPGFAALQSVAATASAAVVGGLPNFATVSLAVMPYNAVNRNFVLGGDNNVSDVWVSLHAVVALPPPRAVSVVATQSVSRVAVWSWQVEQSAAVSLHQYALATLQAGQTPPPLPAPAAFVSVAANSLQVVVSLAAAPVTLRFWARAHSQHATATSPPADFVVVAAPAAPQIASAQGRNLLALITVVAANNGGSPIARYESRYRASAAATATAAAAWSAPVLLPSSASPFFASVALPANGVTHQIQVRAVSRLPGAWSAAANALPLALPAPPAGLALTPRNGFLLASYNASPAVGGVAVVGYEAEVCQTAPGCGTIVSAAVLSMSVGGLANASHAVRLRAVNANGNAGWWSAAKYAMPSPPPARLALSAVGKHQKMALSWQPPQTYGQTGLRYEFRYYNVTATATQQSFVLLGAQAQVTAITVSSLVNGARYAFFGRAATDAGAGEEGFAFSSPGINVPDPLIDFDYRLNERGVNASLHTENAVYGLLLTNFVFEANGSSVNFVHVRVPIPNDYDFNEWCDIRTNGRCELRYSSGRGFPVPPRVMEIRLRNGIGTSAPLTVLLPFPAFPPDQITSYIPRDHLSFGGKIALRWQNSDIDVGEPLAGNIVYYRRAGDGQSTVYSSVFINHVSESYTLAIPGAQGGETYSIYMQPFNYGGKNGAHNQRGALMVGGPSYFAGDATPRRFGRMSPNQVVFTAYSTPQPLTIKSANAAAGQVTLTWNRAAAGSFSITVQRLQTAAIGGEFADAAVFEGHLTIGLATGLPNGVTLRFRMRAENEFGFSQYGNTATAFLAGPPSAPISAVATPTAGGAVLSWLPPATVNGLPITAYLAHYTPQGGARVLASVMPPTARGITLTALQAATPHVFEVAAANGRGASPPALATTTPASPPDAPAGFTLAGGNRKLAASWSPPANTGGGAIVAYELRWRAVGGGAFATLSLTTQTRVTLTGLQNDAL